MVALPLMMVSLEKLMQILKRTKEKTINIKIRKAVPVNIAVFSSKQLLGRGVVGSSFQEKTSVCERGISL